MTAQEIVADLIDQLEHADVLIDAQALRIEALEIEVARLRQLFAAA